MKSHFFLEQKRRKTGFVSSVLRCSDAKSASRNNLSLHQICDRFHQPLPVLDHIAMFFIVPKTLYPKTTAASASAFSSIFLVSLQ